MQRSGAGGWEWRRSGSVCGGRTAAIWPSLPAAVVIAIGAMRMRAWIQVDGQPGAGKTTFVERLLAARVGGAVCVRAERDPALTRSQATAPADDAELRRYRQAGAAAVLRYRFGAHDGDAIYCARGLDEYSELVVIEGEAPVQALDCRVFVTRPLPAGQTLLRRVRLASGQRPSQRHLLGMFEDAPASLRSMLSPEADPRIGELLARLGALPGRKAKPPSRESWALAEGCEGIELAQVVVVNLRAGESQAAAESLIADVARLRQDREVFDDVIGLGGRRLPVTAVATDLLGPADAGWRKVVAKLRRTAQQARR